MPQRAASITAKTRISSDYLLKNAKKSSHGGSSRRRQAEIQPTARFLVWETLRFGCIVQNIVIIKRLEQFSMTLTRYDYLKT
jgi:hypothetical protein